jgi:predicted nucleic acid-binding protein
MDLILDTNALSAWLDGEPLLLPVLNEVGTLFLSPIVLGEYRFGIAASKYRERYETVLGEILNEIDVLPMNDPVAKNTPTFGENSKKWEPRSPGMIFGSRLKRVVLD